MRRPKIVKLKGDQRFKLYDYLRAPGSRDMLTKSTSAEIAKIASKMLSFPVAESSVNDILSHLGLNKRKTNLDINDRFKAIEDRVLALENLITGSKK